MAWKYQRPRAAFRSGSFTGHVDVEHPQLGASQIDVESAAVTGRVCCVAREVKTGESASAWPATLADAYLRGTDLVATYQANDEWPFAPQIYWRAEAPAPNDHVLGSLSLLVSVSTHLLDTHPRISAGSELAADEVLHVNASADSDARELCVAARDEFVLPGGREAGCLVWRLPGGKLSYAEIVPASDFRRLTIRHDGNGVCRSRWELFAEFLEKGVIRRARLLTVFLPRRRDTELAAECCRNFSACPLPLTT